VISITVPTTTLLPVVDELERVSALDGSSLLSCFCRLMRTPLAGGLGASLRLSDDIDSEGTKGAMH
jgi:hypothetical protein